MDIQASVVTPSAMSLGHFEGSETKRRLNGKINGGGPLVSLSTSGGGISIRKR